MNYSPKLNSNRFLSYLLFLYPAAMFLPFAYSNIVLGSTIALFFWEWFNKRIDVTHFKTQYSWYIISIIPWVLTLASALHSNHMSRGFEFVYQRLPILIYPFIFSVVNPDDKSKQWGFKIIILSTLLGVVYSWFKFVFSFPHTFFQFNHTEVQQSTIIQHPYLGMMSLLSMVLLIYVNDVKKYSTAIVLGTATILLSGIVLSTSRLAIVLVSIIGFYLIIKRLKTTYNWVLGSVFILGIVLFVSQTSVLQKFSNEFTFEKSPRLLLWNNAIQLIKTEKELLGIGIGDYYTQKTDTFWFLGDYLDAKSNFKGIYGYECHNTYLEFILLNGVLGLLFIVGIFYVFLYLVKHKKEFNLLLFILLASFMFTETLVLRQWGIIFYVFVMSLILFSYPSKMQSL